MKATLDFESENEMFTALLSNGQLLSCGDPIALAQRLIEAGVAPGDAKWRIWTLENKFEDIMKAVVKADWTWARMATHELWMRMS